MPLASQDVWLRISVADQERGLESVLWYQSMSRVCPEYPQTTPREAREGGCILKAYGEGGTLNLEPRTLNLERPGKPHQCDIKATPKPHQSLLIANPIATLKPPQGYPKATPRPLQSLGKAILKLVSWPFCMLVRGCNRLSSRDYGPGKGWKRKRAGWRASGSSSMVQ